MLSRRENSAYRIMTALLHIIGCAGIDNSLSFLSLQVWFKNRRARWRKQKKERQVKQYQDARIEESTLRHECFVNEGEKHSTGLQSGKEKVTTGQYWTARKEADVYHIEKRQ